MNLSWGVWTAGLGLGLALACNGADDSAAGDGMCIPGQSAFCACPGDAPTTPSGTQVCNALGTFDPCMCGPVATGGMEETEEDTEGDSNSQGGSTTDNPDLCGNGFPDPGECDTEGGEHPCPEDCEVEESTGTTDPGTSTGEDACAGQPIYTGMVPGIEPPWELAGVTGFGAGRMMCQSMVGATSDVCTYENLVDAEANGDFAAVPAGTTMWVHRMVMANYMAMMIPPGNGARCDDWLYDTNHLYDGEFVTVGAGGALTFTLDTDPATPADGLMQCAGEVRAIPCCTVCE